MDKIYSVTNRIIFREYKIKNWKELSQESFQNFLGFAMPTPMLDDFFAEFTLIINTDSDEEIDQEFVEFLAANGYTEVEKIS